MKQIIFLIISAIVGITLQAQDYKINFTASGVVNSLDSVQVENLTQNTELTLNGTDTLHLTQSGTGNYQKQTNCIGVNIYPNPLKHGNGKLSIYLDMSDDVKLEIFDLEGKMLLTKEQYLQAGHNDFLLKGFPSGFIMINVKTDFYKKSIKLISIDGSYEIPQMEFLCHRPVSGNKVSVKNTAFAKSTIAMHYNDGEPLRLYGYADSLVFANTIIPTQSQTVNFHFGSIYPSGTIHCIPGGAAIVAVTNPTTGETWMDRNLGASRVAQSSTDSLVYGDLYQWGRFSDGHQCRNSSTTNSKATTAIPNNGNSWDGKFITEGSSPWDWLSSQNDNLWTGLNGVNNPCPYGYRLPTDNELNSERQSWLSNGASGAYNSPLKLPLAGYRFCDSGSLYFVDSRGNYWSSTVDGSYAYYLYFYDNTADVSSFIRALGNSVRCLKD